MKKRLISALATALICLATAPASATTVQIKETGLANGMWSGGLALPILSYTANYWSGLQTIVVNDTKTLLAFCVDPWEWSPGSNTNYTSSNSLDGIFGSSKANNIRELYSEAYAGTLLPPNQSGNLNAAAFQLALWEIIVDAPVNNHFSLDLGSVHKTGGTDASLVTAAQKLLNNIDGHSGNEHYAFQLYTSGKSAGRGDVSGNQDYLVVNRVPEPGTEALLLAALASAGFLILRRRKAATAIIPKR